MSERGMSEATECRPQRLTQNDIDQRIAAVCGDWNLGEREEANMQMRVRWIRAGELIARVAPFLSNN